MKFYQGGASIAGAERFVKVVFTIQCTMEKKRYTQFWNG
jgi:hypothetical protein